MAEDIWGAGLGRPKTSPLWGDVMLLIWNISGGKWATCPKHSTVSLTPSWRQICILQLLFFVKIKHLKHLSVYLSLCFYCVTMMVKQARLSRHSSLWRNLKNNTNVYLNSFFNLNLLFLAKKISRPAQRNMIDVGPPEARVQGLLLALAVTLKGIMFRNDWDGKLFYMTTEFWCFLKKSFTDLL